MMKSLLISVIVISGALTGSYGQDNGKWSAGVSATPFATGISSALYLNRHLGTRWQVGAMPIFRYQSSSSSSQSIILGLNGNARFYPLNTTRILPYLYSYTGYFREHYTYTNSQGENKIRGDYWNLSLGIGAQLLIGKKGWSVDANVGYFADRNIKNDQNYFRSWFYSFGVFKRFGKSKE